MGSDYRSPTLKQAGRREIWPRFGSTNIIKQQTLKTVEKNQGKTKE